MHLSSSSRRNPATIFLVLMAIVLAATAAWAPAAAAQPTPIPSDALRTITVQGTGIVSTTPDTAAVTLGIRTSNESLKAAQDDVTGRLTTVTETLTGLGIAAEDVKTSSYNINPINEYDDDGNFRGIRGYEVSVSLRVTVRDLDSLGNVLDQSVDAGVNDVWGISMYVNDTTEAANQARQAAMADARSRAEEFARSEGLLITGVYLITEDSAPAPPTQRSTQDASYTMEADMAEANTPVPISPGSTDVRVDVTVVYIIEQGNG